MKLLYEAVCRECGEEFNVFSTLQDFEETLMEEKCPTCGGDLRRSWKGAGHFKITSGGTRRKR
jgi:putative FmdB family regulatory protein